MATSNSHSHHPFPRDPSQPQSQSSSQPRPTLIPLPIPIALIGYGIIGPRHLKSILKTLSFALHSITDPALSSPLLSDRALQATIPKGTPIYADVAALLADGNAAAADSVNDSVGNSGGGAQKRLLPTAAIIATPTATHVPIAISLLKAGVRCLLIEKPLCGSSSSNTDKSSGGDDTGTLSTDPNDGGDSNDSITTLLALAHSNPRIKILIGHHRRFHPLVTHLRSILQSEVLGSIQAVSGLWTALKPAGYFEGVGAWRRKEGLGGGVVLINFVHDVDVLQYLFGRVGRVFAEESNRGRGRGVGVGGGESGGGGDEEGAFDVEEGGAVVLRFEGLGKGNGRGAGVVGSWVVTDSSPSLGSFEGGTGENPNIWTPGARLNAARKRENSGEVQEEEEKERWGGSGSEIWLRIFGRKGSLDVGSRVRRYFYKDADKGKEGWGEELSVEDLGSGEEGVEPLDLQMEHFARVCKGEEEVRCSVEEGLAAVRVCEAVKEAMRTERVVEINKDVGREREI